ncbi:MAG TPA: thioredoxin domain-containing protein [Rhizomicrobium sp.]|jgi:protein-disulfide isomerase
MNPGWKFAAAGGLGGALLAYLLVFATSGLGWMPVNGPAMHRYLIDHPEVMVEMVQALQARDAQKENDTRQAAVDKLGVKAFLDPRVAYVTGPANAKNTVVEFFDYNCPFCRASTPAMTKFYAAHKNDTRFAFIEYPFKGPESVTAARAAIAARKQPGKYVDFHFLMMNGDEITSDESVMAAARKAGLDIAKLKADMQDTNIDLVIARAHTLGDAAKVTGTPTFIVNGKARDGQIDEKKLDAMVKA